MKTVKEVLQTKGSDLAIVAPDVSVFDATQQMSDRGIGSLLVMRDGKLLGVISERDVVYKLVRSDKSSVHTLVEEIMSSHVLVVTPQQTVEDCMALMTEKRVRHLPVVEDDQILGVVSIGDAVKAIVAEQQFVIEQLENYITS
jgi:CBS domain-containing protein